MTFDVTPFRPTCMSLSARAVCRDRHPAQDAGNHAGGWEVPGQPGDSVFSLIRGDSLYMMNTNILWIIGIETPPPGRWFVILCLTAACFCESTPFV